MRRTVLTVTAQAVLVCLLVGLVVAIMGMRKTVTLSVDGERRTVDTFARTVGELLDREGLSVGEHDVVVPSPGERLEDGTLVAYRRARPVMLAVDGRVQRVWTTALDVDEALVQLGIHSDQAYVAVSRSGRVPLEGMDVTVRLPHRVTVLVDGTRITATTTAATVGDLLRELGVTVGPRDVVVPDVAAYPADGATVTVSRISGRLEVRQVPIRLRTVRKADPRLYKGDEVVERAGKPGLLVRRFALTLRDGQVVSRRLLSEQRLKKPVTRVVRYGTRPRPRYVPTADGANWAALARCESGGRPDAVSPNGMYHGLYQFDLQTWRGVGGTGLPSEASPAEQTYRAQLLYRDRGRAPWPVCGKYL